MFSRFPLQNDSQLFEPLSFEVLPSTLVGLEKACERSGAHLALLAAQPCYFPAKPKRLAGAWSIAMAMSQNPVPPVNIPIPTKIRPKWVVHLPMVTLVLNHGQTRRQPHLGASCKDISLDRGSGSALMASIFVFSLSALVSLLALHNQSALSCPIKKSGVRKGRGVFWSLGAKLTSSMVGRLFDLVSPAQVFCRPSRPKNHPVRAQIIGSRLL